MQSLNLLQQIQVLAWCHRVMSFGLCVPPAMRFKFDEWTTLMQGKGKFLLYGEAHYQDIFGNPHAVRGCTFGTRQPGGLFRDHFIIK